MLLNVKINNISDLKNSYGHGNILSDVLLYLKNSGADSVSVSLKDCESVLSEGTFPEIMKTDGLKIYIEVALKPEMQKAVLKYKPDLCCIVPENNHDYGLNVAEQMTGIISFAGPLFMNGINVCLSVDPEMEQIEASANTGVKYIKLNTAHYAEAFGTEGEETELKKLRQASEFAHNLGLTVIAGGGLNSENLKRMNEISYLNEAGTDCSFLPQTALGVCEKTISEIKTLID